MDRVSLLKRAAEIKATIEAQKPLYEELSQITLQLASEQMQEVEIEGLYFSIVDNFATKNTVFKTAGVSRFDLVIQTAEERAYSLMSKSEKAAYTRSKNKELS